MPAAAAGGGKGNSTHRPWLGGVCPAARGRCRCRRRVPRVAAPPRRGGCRERRGARWEQVTMAARVLSACVRRLLPRQPPPAPRPAALGTLCPRRPRAPPGPAPAPAPPLAQVRPGTGGGRRAAQALPAAGRSLAGAAGSLAAVPPLLRVAAPDLGGHQGPRPLRPQAVRQDRPGEGEWGRGGPRAVGLAGEGEELPAPLEAAGGPEAPV